MPSEVPRAPGQSLQVHHLLEKKNKSFFSEDQTHSRFMTKTKEPA